MAYASVITVTRAGDKLRVTIAETDAASTSETSAIETGQNYLTLVSQEADLVSGTGSTIDPEIGTKTAFSLGDGLVYANKTASAGLLNSAALGVNPGVPFYSSDGKLYVTSKPNDASANHVINSTYLFKIGW